MLIKKKTMEVIDRGTFSPALTGIQLQPYLGWEDLYKGLHSISCYGLVWLILFYFVFYSFWNFHYLYILSCKPPGILRLSICMINKQTVGNL